MLNFTQFSVLSYLVLIEPQKIVNYETKRPRFKMSFTNFPLYLEYKMN